MELRKRTEQCSRTNLNIRQQYNSNKESVLRDLKEKWPNNAFHLFLDPKDFELKLPNSCIESAEYGMQCIKLKQRLTYTPPNPKVEPKKPYVMARFGAKIVEQKPENVNKALEKLKTTLNLKNPNRIELIQAGKDKRLPLKNLTDLKQPEEVKKALENTTGVVINISTSGRLQYAGEDLLDLGIQLTNYAFEHLPEVGEGLICLNNTKESLPCNMHLGVVLARNGGTKAEISDMTEERKSKRRLEKMNTLPINDAKDFRSTNYLESDYALGLLEVDPDTLPQFRGGAASSGNETGEEDNSDSSEDEAEEEEEIEVI
jgi:hypothetical protein